MATLWLQLSPCNLRNRRNCSRIIPINSPGGSTLQWSAGRDVRFLVPHVMYYSERVHEIRTYYTSWFEVTTTQLQTLRNFIYFVDNFTAIGHG